MGTLSTPSAAATVNVNDEPVTNIVAAGATVEDGVATLPEGGAGDAASVSYDNAESGLTATDVQALGDELAAAPGGAGAVLSAAVTLTDAQIKALPTTPITIVAAPGAGKVIFPQSALLYHDWTADYTNINGAAVLALNWGSFGFYALMKINQGDNSGVADLLAASADAIATGPAYFPAGAGPDMEVNAASDLVNAAITIEMLNDVDGDLTGGNAANTLKVTVLYAVIDL